MIGQIVSAVLQLFILKFNHQYFSRYRSQNKDQYPDTDPFELQICMIEGTRNGIDRCLELIREKFPLQQYQVVNCYLVFVIFVVIMHLYSPKMYQYVRYLHIS